MRRRSLIIVSVLTLIALGSAAALVMAGTVPTISIYAYGEQDSPTPLISARIWGSGHIYFPNQIHMETVVMKVDGVSVPFDVTNPTGTPLIEYVPQTPLPPRENHTVWVTATDDGGTSTKSSTFYVTALEVDSRYPEPAGAAGTAAWTSDPRQTFSMRLTNTGDPSTLVVTMDGSTVAHSWDAATRTISYTPTSDLSEAVHTFAVSCDDLWGRPFSTSWDVEYSTPPGSSGSDGPVVTSFIPAADTTITLPIYSHKHRLSVSAQLADADGIAVGGSDLYLSRAEGGGYVFGGTVSTTYLGDGTTGSFYAMRETDAGWLEGHYTAQFGVEDLLGNSTLAEWEFAIMNEAPVVDQQAPVDLSSTADRTPDIFARVVDASSGIDEDSVRLLLDGREVTPTLTPVVAPGGPGFEIDYTPPADLEYGAHTMRLDCTDGVGFPTSSEWRFVVQAPGSPPVFFDFSDTLNTHVRVWASDADGLDADTADLYVTQRGVEWHPYSTSLTVPTGGDGTYAELYASIGGTAEGSQTVVATVADSTGATVTAMFDTVRNMAPPLVTPQYQWSPPNYVRDARTPIRATVTDASALDVSSLFFTVDGVEQAPVVTIESTGNATVSWTPPTDLAEEVHSFHLAISDEWGNRGTRDWTVDVRVPPKLVAASPGSGETTTCVGDEASFVAVYHDVTGVDPASVVMELDGDVVAPTVTVDGATCTIEYAWLAGEGVHTVELGLTDVRGAVRTDAWRFSVDASAGYADMAITDNGTCLVCHIDADEGASRYSGSRGLRVIEGGFAETHRIHAGTDQYFHYGNCGFCHWDSNMVVSDAGIEDRCDACHDGTTDAHDTSYSYSFGPVADDSLYVQGGPREQFDCIYCHQGIEGERFAGHAMREEHALDIDAACERCHSAELTREHASVGRTTDAGQAIECATCHESSDPAIQVAYTRRESVKLYGARVLGATTSTFTSDPFVVPGASITGAKLDIHYVPNRWSADTDGLILVEAFSGGTWSEVYREQHDVRPSYAQIPFRDPVRRELTFDPPAEQVRARLVFGAPELGNGPLDIMLFDWESTADEDVTCATCHTGDDHVSAHDAPGAVGGCDGCHSANLFSEHVVTRSLGCEACHESADGAVAATIAGGYGSCEDCHGAVRPHDFPAPTVSYDRCTKCHWTPRHFGDDCQRCHLPFPADAPYYDADKFTDHGYFDTNRSLQTDPAELHRIHVNGSWVQGKFTPSGCDSCHAPAKCQACHTSAVEHGKHTFDADSGIYGATPVLETVARGTSVMSRDRSQATKTTCVAAGCHTRASVETTAFVEPDCAGCH